MVAVLDIVTGMLWHGSCTGYDGADVCSTLLCGVA